MQVLFTATLVLHGEARESTSEGEYGIANLVTTPG